MFIKCKNFSWLLESSYSLLYNSDKFIKWLTIKSPTTPIFYMLTTHQF